MAYFRSNAVHVSPGIVGGTCKEWSQVCHMGEKHVFPSGHLLTFEGDHFDDFLYLQSGKVTGIYLGADGLSNVALFYESGVLLNEKVAILGSCNNPTRYVCETDCIVYVFRASLLHSSEFIQKYPNLIYSMLVGQASKNLSQELIRSSLYRRTALQKLCCFLLTLSQRNNNQNEFAPGISQIDIARLLGMHKSSMARCVNFLKVNGIISKFSKNSLHIINKSMLEKYSLTPFDNL